MLLYQSDSLLYFNFAKSSVAFILRISQICKGISVLAWLYICCFHLELDHFVVEAGFEGVFVTDVRRCFVMSAIAPTRSASMLVVSHFCEARDLAGAS